MEGVPGLERQRLERQRRHARRRGRRGAEEAALDAGIVVHLAEKKVVGGVALVHLLGGIRARTDGRVFLQISHIDGQ